MLKEKKSGIYCIENKINGKKYVGQSRNIQDRWYKHKYELNHGVHYNDYLQKAWNKYGESEFIFSILEYCDIDLLDKKEVYYISLYDTTDRSQGYNLKDGGQLSGGYYTDEVRKKMSQSVKKSYQNSNLKELRKINALNQWADPEYRKKMSGENNGMYGKHHSDESRKKMSERLTGHVSHNRNTTPVYCVELHKIFLDATDASKQMNLDSSSILKVCRGERKTCSNYHWEFVNNLENKIS